MIECIQGLNEEFTPGSFLIGGQIPCVPFLYLHVLRLSVNSNATSGFISPPLIRNDIPVQYLAYPHRKISSGKIRN